MAHVTDGVDVDEEADASDHEDHHAGKRVEQVAPIGDERDGTTDGGNRAGRDPFKKNLLKDALAGIESEKRKGSTGGVQEREKHAAHAEKVDGALRKKAAEEKHESSADEREKWDQPEVLEEIVGGGHGLAFQASKRDSSRKVRARDNGGMCKNATI